MVRYKVEVNAAGSRAYVEFRVAAEAKRFRENLKESYATVDEAMMDAASICPQFKHDQNYARWVMNPKERYYYGEEFMV